MAEELAFTDVLTKVCADKTADYGVRSKLRLDEVAAIESAIDVLNNDASLDIFRTAIRTARGRLSGN